MLRARAIENQAYVAAVNRVGTDGNGHAYAGDSCLIDPGWNKTIQHMEDKDTTATVMLSYEHLQEVRGKLPFLKDADQFSVEE